MLIKKVAPSSCKGTKYTTTYLWSSDGWVYDTVKMIRRKYEVVAEGIFQMTEQPVIKTVFSGVEYSEKLEIILISENPKIWIENGEDTSDMFEEVRLS